MKTFDKLPASFRILVYQPVDNPTLVEYLTYYGYEVIETTDEDVFSKIKSSDFDVCIFGHYKSVDSYDLSVLDAFRAIDKKTPIVFVSGMPGSQYAINAFDAGVDDYVVEPFSYEELIRRIDAVMRRCGATARAIAPFYRIGDYSFDTEKGALYVDNTEIRLTEKECSVLSYLCAYMNEVIPKNLLLQQVWKEDDLYRRRSLDVFIYTLRQYLKMDKRVRIETKRGIGYALVFQK